MKTTAHPASLWLGCSLAAAIGIAALGAACLPALAQQPTDPTAPAAASEAKAEVEDATEAVAVLGEKGSDSTEGFHLHLNPGSGEIVRIGASAHLKQGEKARELVVIFGDATMEGEVDGDMVVVFGDAIVDGPVKGDFVTVMGSTKLGPNARLDGDCVVVGGRLDKDPGAQVRHEPVEVSFGILFGWLKPLGYWMKTGLLLGRPLPLTSGLAWTLVILHFAIYFIIFLLMPKPVEACLKTLQTQTLPAFLVGLLTMVLAVPLIVILAASGVGLLIVPFLWLAMLAAKFVGKTAVLQFAGLRLLERFDPQTSPRSLPAFLAGSALVTVLYIVPVLGLIVYGVLLPLGLGAALIAAAAAFRQNGTGQGPVPTVAVPMKTLDTTGTASPSPDATPSAEASIPDDAPPPSASMDIIQADRAVLPRVGFWLRLAATTLDFILLCWIIPIAGPLFILAWFAYHIGMWTWKGTTIGGIVCQLKIVRIDGRDLDFGVALVRSLGSVLSFMALCLGFFWAGWDKERQAWHDVIAGTTIVKLPKGVSLV